MPRHIFEEDHRGRGMPEPEELYAGLDPEGTEPTYWGGFHEQVLALAGPELERRRGAVSSATVSGVVASWSRTVVPLAMVAAAAALLVLKADREASAGTSAPPLDARIELAVDGGPILASVETEAMPVVLTAAVDAF